MHDFYHLNWFFSLFWLYTLFANEDLTVKLKSGKLKCQIKYEFDIFEEHWYDCIDALVMTELVLQRSKKVNLVQYIYCWSNTWQQVKTQLIQLLYMHITTAHTFQMNIMFLLENKNKYETKQKQKQNKSMAIIICVKLHNQN